MDTFSRPPLRSPPEHEVGAAPPHNGPGAHFRELRCARGLTQEQLAERAELAADTIRRLEYNDFSPTLVTLEKLARGLRVPASGVLEGYEQRERKLEGEFAGVLEAIDDPQRATFLLLVSRFADLVTRIGLVPPGDARAQLDYSPVTIGNHIKGRRRARRMSQAQLAEQAGCSVDTVRRLEHGQGTSVAMVETLSLSMGLSLSVFFEGLELRDARSSLRELDWIDRLDPQVQVCLMSVLEQLRMLLAGSESPRLGE